jgi:hypothetical protein
VQPQQPPDALLRRYWEWVKATQDQFTFGFAPPPTVLLSLWIAVSCVAAPVGLILGLVAGLGAQGLGAGVAVAFPVAFVVGAYAKHRARSAREDRWEPSR